jgi:hypothetical protein
MRLSDNSIAKLVRVLQIAILTGTDITDNLRMVNFIEEEDLLDIDPEYLSTFEMNLEKMQAKALGTSFDTN